MILASEMLLVHRTIWYKHINSSSLTKNMKVEKNISSTPKNIINLSRLKLSSKPHAAYNFGIYLKYLFSIYQCERFFLLNLSDIFSFCIALQKTWPSQK